MDGWPRWRSPSAALVSQSLAACARHGMTEQARGTGRCAKDGPIARPRGGRRGGPSDSTGGKEEMASAGDWDGKEFGGGMRREGKETAVR